MTTSELKLKIFRQVDSLDKSRLEDFYGVLTNFINGQKEIDDWIEISKFRKKYSHANTLFYRDSKKQVDILRK